MNKCIIMHNLKKICMAAERRAGKQMPGFVFSFASLARLVYAVNRACASAAGGACISQRETGLSLRQIGFQIRR